jgi:hypothetical protein
VDYIYTYKKSHGDQLRWLQCNRRVGLCVGLLNGTIYFLLLLIPIYTFGYLTTQLASGAEDPASVRILNTARKELKITKMDKVVGAVAPAKPEVYQAMDIVGLIYKNPLLESRISRYPPILTLAERGEFQELANDVEFHNLWQSGAKISDLLNYPKVHSITTNAALMAEIQNTLLPDLKDLQGFLRTGKSEKYDSEKILGRWELDLAATFNGEKARRQNVSSVELKQLRARLLPMFGATLTATTDGKVLLKRGDEAPVPEGQNRTIAQGSWNKEGSGYKISLDDKPVETTLEGDKLLIDRNGIVFVFEKEI